MRSMLLAVLLALWGVAAHAQTQTLVDVATVSMSAPGVPRTVSNTVCATDGNDLVCDRGVYVTPAGQVGIGMATPSATFHVVSNKNINSGSNFNDRAGNVLLTDNGSGATGLLIDTNQIEQVSATDALYLNFNSTARTSINYGGGDVGIGKGINPQYPLHVSGTVFVNHGEIVHNFSGIGSGSLRSIRGNYGVIFRNDGSSFYILQTAPNDTMGTWTNARPLGFNLSTGHVFLAASNSTGVTVGANTTANTKLDVYGSLKIAAGSEACDVNRTGAIRYTGGDFSFCRNGSSWETLASVANGALSDRIVSGTSSVIVNSATSNISFTTAGTEAMVITSESRVGIGTLAPAYRLHIVNAPSSSGILMRDDDTSGYIALREGTTTSGTFAPTIQFTPIGVNRFSLIDNVMASADDTGAVPTLQIRTRNSSGNVTRPLLSVQNYMTEVMRLTASGNLGLGTDTPSNTLHIYGPSASGIVIGRASAPQNHGIIDYSSSTLTIGTKANDGVVFQTNGYSRFGIDRSGFITTRGDVGVNIYPIQPSASLHVSGTIRFADGGEACDANRTGAIRYTGGDFSFCRNGSAWETLTSLGGGGGLSDRITSGTSVVVVNSATGIVSISQLGAVASYVHPSIGYVGPGVSTTGAVSTTRVYLAATPNQCATAADIGSMFRSATTGRLQICAERN